MIRFIDVQTVTDDMRKVSLLVNDCCVFLLGNLPHNTQLLIDQELVDWLQEYVDEKKEKEVKP